MRITVNINGTIVPSPLQAIVQAYFRICIILHPAFCTYVIRIETIITGVAIIGVSLSSLCSLYVVVLIILRQAPTHPLGRLPGRGTLHFGQCMATELCSPTTNACLAQLANYYNFDLCRGASKRI